MYNNKWIVILFALVFGYFTSSMKKHICVNMLVEGNPFGTSAGPVNIKPGPETKWKSQPFITKTEGGKSIKYYINSDTGYYDQLEPEEVYEQA